MKVYCVFEESTHEDYYEQENDGKFLVAVYADIEDARRRMREESDKIEVRPVDTKDLSEDRIELSQWDEVMKDGEIRLSHYCDWCWSVEEQEVL